jgi:phosphatidylserine decarboxylase
MYVDRTTGKKISDGSQDRLLSLMYGTAVGRSLIGLLIKPTVSELFGKLLSTRLSALLIKPFIRLNGIDMSEYEPCQYGSYNDFFIRRLKSGSRYIDYTDNVLIAPCDSKLSVYKINKNSSFRIKNTVYTTESLFRSKQLADMYAGGTMLVFRLTVDDYHHYCYVDDGIKTPNHHINGVFHTVNPIANDYYPIYKENTREYSLLKSKHFGNVLMMEVGALMVGKIVNYHNNADVKRGQEKGRFEFGGSTVVLCLQKGQAEIDNDIIANSAKGLETRVKLGEKIGYKTN